MSYLDNLENNLKALEAAEQRDPEKAKRDLEAKEAARAEALKIAPHAEALKSSAFTEQLLAACRTVGHSLRTMVRFTWIGNTLRLEAKEKKLELRPTADGVVAVFTEGGNERSTPIDLSGNAETFARTWLTGAQNT